jgi:hypothetical protein
MTPTGAARVVIEEDLEPAVPTFGYVLTTAAIPSEALGPWFAVTP